MLTMSDIESFVARQRERFAGVETERQITAVRAAIEALDPRVTDRRFTLPAECELSARTIEFFRSKGLVIVKQNQSGHHPSTHLYSFDFVKTTPAFDSTALWTPVSPSTKEEEKIVRSGWPDCDGWCSWGCVHPNPCKCNGILSGSV